jgi:dolichol kinase
MGELELNLAVAVACYAYVAALIVITPRVGLPRAAGRKLLHAAIGALPLAMPFFTSRIYPFLVASPFVLITYLASPYSPLRINGLAGLADLTEEGHPNGLILYSAAYSGLALLFGDKPYVVAAGVFPMAFGDSLAALVGRRFGRHRFTVTSGKSLEGSFAMFAATFASLTLGLAYFSAIYGLNFNPLIPAATAAVTTIAEAMSPRGLDNIAVPLTGALTFLLLAGVA